MKLTIGTVTEEIMSRTLSIAFAGFVLAGVVSAQEKPKLAEPAKDDFDSLVASMVKTLTEVGEALSKITDDKAAKEAAPKLEQLAKSMAELTERGQKLGKPSGDEEKALKTKYEADLTAASKKLTGEIERLKGQPYGKAVLDFLKPKPKTPNKPKDTLPEKPKDK
jgi:hypothetical protein